MSICSHRIPMTMKRIGHALYGLYIVVASSSLASQLTDENISISVVAQNGMPKHIVKLGSRWNFGYGSLWTHKGWQYAAYWDDAKQVSIARRELPSGDWSVVSLPDYQRTESGDRGKGGRKSRGFGDGHEKVVMGISSDGIIHLSFDHHLSTLRYRTSLEPVANNPAAYEWTADLFGPVQDNLGGHKITFVTYPSFSTDGEHFALYLRLGGGSGSANSHFFAYKDGKWSPNTEKNSQLIDKRWSGGNGTVNAYPHVMVIHNGRRHLTWCWRDTPDSSTCHDLCYAYSDDGITWKNSRGDVVAEKGKRFIAADTPGIAVWDIPPGTRFLNGGSMAVDADGRVHVLMRGEDGPYVHFQRDPTSWEWTRKKSASGKLIAGKGRYLYIISNRELMRTLTKGFGKIETIASVNDELFKDSSMGIDRTRVQQDGWISVIGQSGKTVSVVDYQVENR